MLASGKDYTKMTLIWSNIYDAAIATISYNPAANSTFAPPPPFPNRPKSHIRRHMKLRRA